MEEIKLKSPICSVLGHVDTGKTTFLDKVRQTNIQNKEAGGITQQMGATFFSKETLSKLTKNLVPEGQIKIPGILIMDTPGHEMFSDMRDQGSSICNLAILIVDITHGLENQTYESIELLRKYNTPFVVALTKLDRITEWESREYMSIKDLLEIQNMDAQHNFWNRVNEITSQLNNLGFNADLFHLNKKKKEYISLIPISSKTGDGFPDIFTALIGITQKFMTKKITYRDNVRCIALEIRELEGVGKAMDVILANGKLKIGDKILFLTNTGCKESVIKRLYTPPEGKEIRVRSDLISHESIEASCGVKIFADDIENAVPGNRIHVINELEEEEINKIRNEMNKYLQENLVSKNDIGINIQTSSMGSLNALCKYFESNKINIAYKGIGNLNKIDIIKIQSQLSKSKSKKNHVLLVFDLEINKNKKKDIGDDIKIFENNHIYTLISEYEKYREDIGKQELEIIKNKYKDDIQIPVTLKIIPKYVFNKSDPILVGVKIKEGTLYLGTNLRTINNNKFIDIGEVIEIRLNDKEVDKADKDSEVSIKIKTNSNVMYGRHFDNKNLIFTKVTTNTVKMLKMLKKQFRIDIELLNDLLTKNKISQQLLK